MGFGLNQSLLRRQFFVFASAKKHLYLYITVLADRQRLFQKPPAPAWKSLCVMLGRQCKPELTFKK
jgi:hypothetical protein